MSGQLRLRGTGSASWARVTEGILALAAAVETVLLAGLVLTIGRVGAGSGLTATFWHVHSVLLRPFGRLPFAFPVLGVEAGGRLVVAAFGYGVAFLILAGAVSWFGRWRALA